MEISEVLIRRGLLTPEQGEQVREQANGHRFDKAVIQMGLLTEEQTLQAFADELGMQYVQLKDFEIDPELLNLFPTSTIYRHSLLPLRRENGRVEVATSDPFDLEALDELSSLSNLRLEPGAGASRRRRAADQGEARCRRRHDQRTRQAEDR